VIPILSPIANLKPALLVPPIVLVKSAEDNPILLSELAVNVPV
jgi:hypothetical protein